MEAIFNIEKKIWSSLAKENRIGLYLGLSGTIMFYDYLYEAFPVEEFENKLLAIIEKANELIEEGEKSISLCSGVAGYGLALLRLKNKNIDISEEYYEAIDVFLLEDFESMYRSNNFDFMHEAMGIAMYFIERYKSNKSIRISMILSTFSENLISKINIDFKNVLVKSDETRGDYYSFGLAHGIAGYLNFLIYLKKHFTALSIDITKSLRVCVDFLFTFKQYNNQSKQYYSNVISLKTRKIIPSRLSWCQGDLGISNALYNTGVFLNDTEVVNEAKALMDHSATISFEDSAVDDFGLCHGSTGILIQFYLASKKYNVDYSHEIHRWFEVLKKQTKNFEENLWYENSSCSYIPEINLLVGSVGLGLTLLTIEKKIDTKWLEILNLY